MSRETAIRAAQTLLRVFEPALTVDGKWGPMTQRAFTNAPHTTRIAVIKTVADQGDSVNDIQAAAEKAVAKEAEVRANDREVAKRPITPFGAAMSGLRETSQNVVRAVKRALTSNEEAFRQAVAAEGLTPSEIAMLMAQVKAESNFQPRRESHRYSLAFKKNFGAISSLSDDDYLALQAKGPEAFFEAVYGHKTAKGKNELGNDQPGDGYRYRGGGYKQLTGKANYAHYGKLTGLDLVSNPEQIDDPAVSAKVAAAYWKDRVRGRGNAMDVRFVTGAFAGHKAVDAAVVRLAARDAYSKEYVNLLT